VWRALTKVRTVAGSLGESNAVFLWGVRRDAATEQHKTGISGIRKRNFPVRKVSCPHMDLNTGFLMRDGNDGSVPTHVGEGGRFAVRIR